MSVLPCRAIDTAVAIVGAGRIVRNDGAEIVVPWWSFTKTLIAAAALALARDGALRLDDLLPGRPYSMRLLLQHRAGLADYGGLERYHEAVSRDEAAWPLPTLIQAADAERLRFEPGRGWGYSNIGYLIARQHLEALCGENLNALLRRLVFDPLGIAGPRVALTRGDLDGVTLGSISSYDPQWVYHGLVVGPLHRRGATAAPAFDDGFSAGRYSGGNEQRLAVERRHRRASMANDGLWSRRHDRHRP